MGTMEGCGEWDEVPAPVERPGAGTGNREDAVMPAKRRTEHVGLLKQLRQEEREARRSGDVELELKHKRWARWVRRKLAEQTGE